MANDGDIRKVPNQRLAELLDWAESEESEPNRGKTAGPLENEEPSPAQDTLQNNAGE